MEIKTIPLKKVLLAFLILCLALLACVGTLTTPGEYMEEFGGDVDVYVRILGSMDCTELLKEFEQADESVKQQERGTQEYRVSLGYRTAAESRMKEVECTVGL